MISDRKERPGYHKVDARGSGSTDRLNVAYTWMLVTRERRRSIALAVGWQPEFSWMEIRSDKLEDGCICTEQEDSARYACAD